MEVRRIRVSDVHGVQDGMLWVRGKERDEWAPVLPESLERLQELGQGLTPDGCIFQGQRGPLGEDGMSQLVDRLYARAGIRGVYWSRPPEDLCHSGEVGEWRRVPGHAFAAGQNPRSKRSLFRISPCGADGCPKAVLAVASYYDG